MLSLALVAAAAGATAQGMFYREVEKDGRIYVFNDMRAYDRFEKGGEMAAPITRPGYGPDKETVVFDSEEAIHLYNFKHGRPGEVRIQPTPPPPPTVSWRDGTTTLSFPDRALVRINNRVQVRFTNEFPDGTVQLPGTSAPGDDRPSFRIRRAKFKVDGWFYKPWLLYEVQLNWPAVTTANNPGAILEDAYIQWDPTKGSRRFMIKLGQYKVPLGRQQLTSSGSQQMVDRSQVSDQYARGRDLGLQLWGVAFANKVEWRVGAFNGNGLTRSTNDNDTFQYNARLMFQPRGAVALGAGSGNSGPLYSEADFESRDAPIWAVAVSFERNDFHGTTAAVDFRDDIWAFDYTFKFKRFSSVGEVHLREREPEPAVTRGPVVKFDSNGWFVQAGYLLDEARHWEVAGRYGTFDDPTSRRSGDDQREIRGGLNYYYNRHALKVQADFGQLESRASGRKNRELRIQTQFLF
ncbi:MAG TPA: porin [Vicinamibacteria bacterium]|nr:porin [Vicinamibacteria bacterium]